MIDALRAWILRLTCAALISAAATALTPEGGVKKAVQFACGLLTVTALLSAAVSFRTVSFSRYTAQYRVQAEQIADGAESSSANLLRSGIEEKCEAYILDKGHEAGIDDLSAEVSAKWSEDGYWYPASVVIVSDATGSQQAALGRSIEAELGIPEESQVWSTKNG